MPTIHAPKGGTTVAGKQFPGGEFTPGNGTSNGTPAAKSSIQSKANPNASKAKPGKWTKPKASGGEMAQARREGKSLVLSDGSPAPEHIKPSMVPPNWSDVRVSLDPKADVLVKAKDQAGRIKTVYADSYTMKTAANKFARSQEMLKKHDKIHAQNMANRSSKDPAIRDAADCTWLIDQQGTRPGSDGDTKARVKAYGATTLTADHVVKAPDGVRLQFIGKEGVYHDHLIKDPALGEMLLKRKADAGPGGRLFNTTASKLNQYISKLDGGLFTAKDFRTKRANLLAVDKIKQLGIDCCKTAKDYKAKVKEVAEKVSHVLGNRASQALESYINPSVFSVWRNGDAGSAGPAK